MTITKEQNKTGSYTTQTYEEVARKPRFFIAIQGPPGSGKTTASLTFPNPTLCSFDDNLPNKEHLTMLGVDVSKIKVLPFANADWIEEYRKASGLKQFNFAGKVMTNRRDAFSHYLQNDAKLLAKDETLILDSWTAIQRAFDYIKRFEPEYSDKGKPDKYAPWRAKLEWSTNVMDQWLKELNCHVVVIFHELPLRDPATNMLLEAIGPLMQGQFVRQIPSYFSNYYRQLCVPVKEGGKVKKNEEGTEVMEYVWQIKPSADFTFGRSTMITPKSFVPAHYKSLAEFKATEL